MELEFEKLYVKLFLPSVRHGAGGARKRYAGLKADSDRVEFVGMEVVRRDWTELAKEVQRELYTRLFADQPVAAYRAGKSKRDCYQYSERPRVAREHPGKNYVDHRERHKDAHFHICEGLFTVLSAALDVWF